jgi:hypothetical protein
MSYGETSALPVHSSASKQSRAMQNGRRLHQSAADKARRADVADRGLEVFVQEDGLRLHISKIKARHIKEFARLVCVLLTINAGKIAYRHS